MVKRVTKKHIEELTQIIKTSGYWCNDVKEYYSKFEFTAMEKLDNKVKINCKKLGYM